MSQVNGLNEVDISAFSENVVIEEFSDFGAVVEIESDLIQEPDESNGVDITGAIVDFHTQPTEISSSNGCTVVDDEMSYLDPGGPSVSLENVAADADSANSASPVKEESDLTPNQEANSSGNVNSSSEFERNQSNVVKEESVNAFVLSSFDSVSHLTDINRAAETGAAIKKEEDIDGEEDGTEASVFYGFDVSPEQQNDTYDEVSIAKCEEKLNLLDEPVAIERRCTDGVQPSEVYYDRDRIRLVEVSVVLKDIFPKDRAGNRQRLTLEDFRVKLQHANGVENLNVQQKVQESEEVRRANDLQRQSEESVVKEWYSCTECPARFRFAHSLALHATRSHQIYFCTECDVSFKLQSDLRTHFTTHRLRKPYSCLCCRFKSKTELELRIHAKAHRSEKLFSCGECFAQFEESRLLLTHLSGHSNEKRFMCAHCEVKFRTKSGIRAHVLDHLGKKPYTCTLCSAKFKQRKRLKEHLTRHSKEKPHLCAHCPATFRFIRELKTHLSTHAKKPLFYEKIFSCSVCVSKFKFSSDLKEHMAVHHVDKKKLSCAKCATVFKTKTAMKRHEASHLTSSQSKESSAPKNRKTKTKPASTMPSSKNKSKLLPVIGSEDKPFACPHCSVSFKQKKDLTKHLLVHSQDRPFSCPDCDSTFKTKEYLKLHHLVTHTNERQFVCTYCQSTFKTKKGLRQHTLIHFNVKPFACSHCSATFKHKKVLSLHMVTHTNARPHSCLVCSASFRFKGSLQRHMASHSDDKVFACPHCPAKLKQERYLRDHIRMHENNTLRRKISCPHCRASFKSQSCLKRHLAKHTDGKLGFSCPRCPLNFKQNRFLLTHLKTHANETVKEKFSCGRCLVVFETRSKLDEHSATHSDSLAEKRSNEKIQEPIFVECPAKFEAQPTYEHSADDSDKLTEANRTKEVEQMLFAECPAETETQSVHKEQSAIHSDKFMETCINKTVEQAFSFVDCTARFKTKPVHEQDLAETGEVGETFSFVDCVTRIKAEPTDEQDSAFHLDKFIGTVNKEAFSFVDCSVRVKTESILEQLLTDNSVSLMEMDSNEEVETFYCEQCSAVFQTWQDLEKHAASHSNEPAETLSKFLQCRRFRPILPKHPAAANQDKHVESLAAANHVESLSAKKTGESFVCAHCRAQFKTRLVLVQHLATHHHGYACRRCGAKFKNRSSLLKHIGEHESLPYVCKHCPAKFTRQHNYWQHLRKHVDEENVSNVCSAGESFVTELTSEKLEGAHSIQGQICCALCSVCFQNRAGLVHHWESHHSNLVPWNRSDFDPVEWENKIEQLNISCPKRNATCLVAMPQKQVDEKKESSVQCADESSVAEANSEKLKAAQSVQERIYCTHCPLYFQDHAGLAFHLKKYHSDALRNGPDLGAVECENHEQLDKDCPKRVPTRIQAASHEKHADEEIVLSDESSETEANWEKPQNACSVQEPIRCILCSLHFQNRLGLAFHWEKHHSDVPRDHSDGDPSEWQKQLKEIGDVYARLECPAGFKRQESHKTHSTSHETNENRATERFAPVPLQFFCNVCSGEFKDRVSLECHLKNSHKSALACRLKVEFVRTLEKIV